MVASAGVLFMPFHLFALWCSYVFTAINAHAFYLLHFLHIAFACVSYSISQCLWLCIRFGEILIMVLESL